MKILPKILSEVKILPTSNIFPDTVYYSQTIGTSIQYISRVDNMSILIQITRNKHNIIRYAIIDCMFLADMTFKDLLNKAHVNRRSNHVLDTVYIAKNNTPNFIKLYNMLFANTNIHYITQRLTTEYNANIVHIDVREHGGGMAECSLFFNITDRDYAEIFAQTIEEQVTRK